MHPISLARNLNLAVVRWGGGGRFCKIAYVFNDMVQLLETKKKNPAATSSFKAGVRIPCLHWR